MKQFLSFLMAICLLFSSCKDKSENKNENKSASGSRVYGGTLRVNETEAPENLYPCGITDAGSAFVAGQIYEGLVKFNVKDLTIKPSLAEKWEVDSTSTLYTFHLKKGVKFQDDECFPQGKGREVKASDFKYSFEKLCTDHPENSNFTATFKDRILGANKYFEQSKNSKTPGDLEGIKIIDDYTIQIKLYSPVNSFLYTLANPAASVVAKEAVEKYGKNIKVGTGPFIYAKHNNEKERIILKRNENYHGIDSLGNKLPFLDSIIVSFLPTKKEEIEKFRSGALDLVMGLPSESVKELVEENISKFENKPAAFILDRTPEMVTQYYEFNMTRPPFDNVNVRKAFCYAINKNKIVEDVLKGEAYGPGVNGICPPSFPGYNISKIKGYEFDAQKAKKLLAEAGYPGGKGFPVIKLILNSGGAKNSNVAFEIQKQLMDVLGVRIELEVVSLAQKIEYAKYAQADLFRTAWVADFPSPENFLWTLYGETVPASLDKPSYPNTPRYRNSKYDELFDKGRSAKDKEESYKYFLEAEQQMIDDAPVMVLWYDENYRLIQSRVKNFHANPMRYRDYSQIYIQSVTPQDSTNKQQAKIN